MRPTTPLEAFTAKHHLSRGVDHEWAPGCCEVERLDRMEAMADEADFAALGWHLAHDLSLPTEAPSRGPRTSDTAAESIDNLNDRQWAVWWLLLARGPFTDESLAEDYDALMSGSDSIRARGHLLPKQTPQSIRTRRKELERAGHVRDSGERRLTKSGRPAIVWAAVGEARVAA